MGYSTVKAFAPGHISGYFKRVDGETLKDTGSIGAGIVIDRGVSVTMTEASSTTVQLQGKEDDGWLVKEALQSLGITSNVSVEAQMPIGSGFGMSAACLLAVFHAANRLYSLKLSNQEISELSHEIEVKFQTGLGDVAAASHHGIVIRNRPGIKGIKNIFTSEEVIYSVSFGEISTPDIISSCEDMKRVSDAFPEKEPATLMQLMENSRLFAEKSGFVTRKVRNILKLCDASHVPASMTMLGEGVFAIGRDALSILEKFGTVYELHVAKSGPCILEENYV